MKKLFLSIVSIFIFFSIGSNVIAEDGYIENLLDLNYGIESYKLQLSSMDYVYFYDQNTNEMYENFVLADSILKDEIIELYRNDEIDYYTMNGIVESYNLFIYHTNKLFNYVSIKEIRSDSAEVDTAILNNYELSRSYFRKAKNLLLIK